MGSLERIIEIIAKEMSLKKETILPESKLVDDLGCDELDIIEIAMELEEALGHEITDEAMDKFMIVQDIADYIDGRK